MRAFLSHSSLDKGYVEAVADHLRPGAYELDSRTFDLGLINSSAIIESLKRSNLFCLFISNASVRSSYVDFETLLGTEFFARGGISKFIAICLDHESFSQASANVKFFNIVRYQPDIESTARLIEGHLISALSGDDILNHPFIGRATELSDLENQVSDHRRPVPKLIHISGNSGSGRRTIGHKFFEHQYPQVGHIYPVVKVDEFSGIEELHREVLISLRPSISASELRTRLQSFEIANQNEKYRQVAQLFNSLLIARETALVMDLGGILTDAGGYEKEFDEVVSHLNDTPHPPVIVISPRMIPRAQRRPQNDVAYLGVRSLGRDATERLISRLFKDRGVSINTEQLDELISISDGHPYNIYRIVEEASDCSVDVWLANTVEFINWKHRQSSEYIGQIDFSDSEALILGLLKIVPQLDFKSIVDALSIEPAIISNALVRLTSYHVVEAESERFSLSPALKIAVERDRRIKLPSDVRQSAINSVANSLSVRLQEGTVSIALVNSAVISAIDSGSHPDSFVAAFLLPSHYVFLAKRYYDESNYRETVRLGLEALKSTARLSQNGFVSACRYICLAASRIGESTIFDTTIQKLENIVSDDWARSNVAYLKGFNMRMKGALPKAEEMFRDAYRFSPGNTSASREIAAICLARGNLDEAEKFSREAHGQATSNAFLIDILVSVLVRKYGKSAAHRAEIDDLFDVLSRVGEEGGRSFYTTRKAEFEHYWGNNRKALTLIQDAFKKTPQFFEPKRLYVEILLKEGNRTKAWEILELIKAQVNSRDPSERRSNYRAYLETLSHYLVETSRFTEAKEVYNDSAFFTEDERRAGIKEIEITQVYKKRR